MSRKEPLKRFKVYWFTGDYWSTEGEEQHCCVISAHSELEAEYIFKRSHSERSFGWAEEIKKKEDNYE